MCLLWGVHDLCGLCDVEGDLGFVLEEWDDLRWSGESVWVVWIVLLCVREGDAWFVNVCDAVGCLGKGEFGVEMCTGGFQG